MLKNELDIIDMKKLIEKVIYFEIPDNENYINILI